MESTADLGAIILEMEREEDLRGKYTERMAELAKVRALQERVLQMMMEKGGEGDERRKGLRLRVVE